MTFRQVREALANTVMDWPDKDDATVKVQIGEVGGLRIKVEMMSTTTAVSTTTLMAIQLGSNSCS